MNNSKVLTCSNVDYAFIEDVESISTSAVVLKPGVLWKRLYSPNAALSETSGFESSGLTVNQRLSLTALISSADRSSLANGKLIMRLALSTGETIFWGTHELPVRYDSGNVAEGESRFLFGRKTTAFEFF